MRDKFHLIFYMRNIWLWVELGIDKIFLILKVLQKKIIYKIYIILIFQEKIISKHLIYLQCFYHIRVTYNI